MVKERGGGIVNLQLTLSENFQYTFYSLNHAKREESSIPGISCWDQVVMSSTLAMLTGLGLPQETELIWDSENCSSRDSFLDATQGAASNKYCT